MAGELFDALWDAGQEFGVAMVGMHAAEGLRVEKQYMVTRDLTHDVNPDEAGLHRFVKVDKGDFVGREALLARRARHESGEEPYRWTLAYLAVDTDVSDVHGSDGVYHDGKCIGMVTTGHHGYHLDQGFAFAYLRPEYAEPGTELEVRVVGDLKPARVLSEPAYDAPSERLRM